MRYLRAVIFSARVEIQHVAVEPVFIVILFLEPAALAVLAVYVLRSRPDFLAAQVAAGVALNALWTQAVAAGAALYRERVYGTLELLSAAPVPLPLIIAGKILGHLGFSLTSAVFTVGVVAAFGYPLEVRDPAGLAVSALLSFWALWATAVFLAPVPVFWPEVGRFSLGYVVFILSGFLFPVDLLPWWVRPVCYVLPSYWSAVAVRGAVAGTLPAAALAQAWGFLTVASLGLLGLGVLLFRAAEDRARREGWLARV